MAEGRTREGWQRMSHLLALLANCHRDQRKTSEFSPADFDPFAALDRAKTPRPQVGVEVLKAIFIDRMGPVG